MFAHVLFYFSTFSFIQTAETVWIHSCVSLFKAPQTLQQLDRPKETQNISVIEHNTLKTTSEKLLLSLYPSTCYQNIEKLTSDCMNPCSITFWNPWPNVNGVLYWYELWEPNPKYWHWIKWAWMFCPLVLENKYIKTNKRTQGIRDYCWKTWSFSNRGILPTRTKLDPKWKQPNHINISHKWFPVLHTVMHSEMTTYPVNCAKAAGNMQSFKSCQNIKSPKIFPC